MKTSLFLFAFVPLAVVGCSASPQPPQGSPRDDRAEITGTARQPIIGGTASTAEQDAVVQLSIGDDANASPLCTGTLIGRKVVLTARHCVATFNDAGDIIGDSPASAFYVYTGTRASADASSPARAAGRGTQLFVAPTNTYLNADIALIVLDRAVAGPIATIRLDAPPKIGEELTLVGWGITEDDTSPAVRLQRSGARVLGVGITASTSLSDVGDAEFRLGEGTCFGDSGGPSFATTTMALLGIVSRGGNALGERSARTCIGDDVEDIHTSIAGFKPLVLQAFAAAGEEPRLEPQSAPPLPPATAPAGPTAPAPGDGDDEETQRAAGRQQPVAADSSGCSSAPSGNRAAPTSTGFLLALAASLVVLRRSRDARRRA